MLRFSKDDAADLGMSALLSKAPDQAQTTAIATVITTGFLLYHYLRRLYYPCLTISDLVRVEKLLKDTFNNANSTSSLCGYELEEVTQAKLRLLSGNNILLMLAISLEERASEIRYKSLQGPPSFWKTRLGIEVELIPTIVEWYTDLVGLERKILIIVERVTRTRINNELRMREATYTPADDQVVAITGREVVDPQAVRHRDRRPGASTPGAAVDTTITATSP
ncbi:40S ribosomal protein S6 [Paramarasmius palmivorus]|uniref:40S ribosomal protein S6 n=1 Tax=Paramarasmius palmivorus TaxID=297713 RepID=A0AAW0AY00_9AGAR